jgi:uncharacterized protein (DUF2235 family)
MANSPAVSSKPDKKRLALFLDGTWNVVADNTNVWRMKTLCAPTGTDGMPQLIYYNPGVGTQFGYKIRGGAFGYGLDDVVIDAYEWLIDHYEAGDEIFIFGYSRGAYSARSLAGLVAKCGLLSPGAPLGVKQIYARYRLGSEARTLWAMHAEQEAGRAGPLSLEEQWMLKYSMRVRITFVGVWETVGSLGVPAFHIAGLSRPTFGFLHTGLRLPIEHGFHAMAVDEHREAFATTLWTKRETATAPDRPLASLEQRWFVGSHGNVGGGCESDLLAQLPLRWMMTKAASLRLGFRGEVALDGDAAVAPISDSFSEFMHGLYRLVKLGRPYYRPIDHPAAGEHNVNETIDASVFERWRRVPGYRPQNLSDWAGRHGVDIAGLTRSVLASDPRTAVPD